MTTRTNTKSQSKDWDFFLGESISRYLIVAAFFYNILTTLLTTTQATHTIVGGSIVRIILILWVMNIKEKFGQKVKQLREQRGFSIEQLANISNVDRNYISDIEKGKRNVSIEVIEKITTGLETDLATFFNDKGFKR